jgi:hypothetical protein
MSRQTAHSTAKQRNPKPRKFYIISFSLRHERADFEVENLNALHMGAGALYPPEGGHGFPLYPEKPRVVLGKQKEGPLPNDIELFHSYWLISDQLKTLFEAFDPAAFAFQPCDVRLRDESPGPAYWLCDVVRVIEAFGQRTVQEIQEFRERTGSKYMGLMTKKNDLDFNEDVIGPSRIFRTPYSREDTFCDPTLKDACKAAGIRGVAFYDCSPKRKHTQASPAVEQKSLGGSESLRELRERLLACGDATKALSLAIAARSVLRAIPLLERLSWDKPLPKRMRPSVGRPRMSNSAIVLGCFRSAATAWVAALFPAFGTSKHFDAIKEEARMAGGAEDAGGSPASAVGAAAGSAMMVAILVFHKHVAGSSVDEQRQRQVSAHMASQAPTIASQGFMAAYDPQAPERFSESRDPGWITNRELSAPERAIWDAAWDDVRQWDSVQDTRVLLTQPLWLAAAPPYVRADWANLSARLRGSPEEHWEVWIDWYEARLGGRAGVSEGDEIARVSLANDVWAQGAAAANASLSRFTG